MNPLSFRNAADVCWYGDSARLSPSFRCWQQYCTTSALQVSQTYVERQAPLRDSLEERNEFNDTDSIKPASTLYSTGVNPEAELHHRIPEWESISSKSLLFKRDRESEV